MTSNVLVTGGAGYIGSVLVRQLLAKGYNVRVLDSLKFGGDALLDVSQHPRFDFVHGDLRDKNKVSTALRGVQSVAHLAAIVGDPACKKFSNEANEVNGVGSEEFFSACEQNDVEKFVFASTCSNYGKMADPNAFVTEDSELRPVSLYAELKVAFESFILHQKSDSKMCATALRFSTVYGFSPRIRFDLTVNEFTRNVALTGQQEIWGPEFNRPYCHVDDLSRAVVLVLESPAEKVKSQVFNVGHTNENYTKRNLMEEMAKVIPNVKAHYVDSAEDPRDYRVNCDKIKNQLGFTITKTVPDGIREIYKLIQTGLIADPHSPKFRNV